MAIPGIEPPTWAEKTVEVRYERELANLRARLTAAEAVINAADIAYTEMAFTLQDIMCPDRRKDDEAWRDVRGKSLSRAADKLRAALRSAGRET